MIRNADFSGVGRAIVALTILAIAICLAASCLLVAVAK